MEIWSLSWTQRPGFKSISWSINLSKCQICQHDGRMKFYKRLICYSVTGVVLVGKNFRYTCEIKVENTPSRSSLSRRTKAGISCFAPDVCHTHFLTCDSMIEGKSRLYLEINFMKLDLLYISVAKVLPFWTKNFWSCFSTIFTKNILELWEKIRKTLTVIYLKITEIQGSKSF